MKLAILLTAAIAVAPGLAPAQTIPTAPDTIIAARQSAFLLSAGTFTGMKTAIGDNESVKQWADFAGGLAEWAGVIPTLFPAGTDKGHDTKALPAIWTDRPGFEKAAAAYADAAKMLQAAAKTDDKEAFAAAFKQTAKACGACHKKYRQKDD